MPNYATLFPQLIGAGASIASAIPNAQDRQQRRIAMGGEDPALASIRRQLAAQNAQTAMSVAASQQGVNPALAQRNAQQALAQQQVQTNSELARLGVSSAMQARQSDPKGQKISAALSGVGQFANVLGTGLAAQDAGMAAGLSSPLQAPVDPAITDAALKQQLLAAQSPMQLQTMGGPQSAMGLAAPSEAAPMQAAAPQPMMPVGMDGQPLFDVNAPSAAAGVPSAQLPTGGQVGSGVGGLGTLQTPAAPVVPQVAIPPMTGLQLPQSNQVPASQVLGQMSAPQPTGASPRGQLSPGQGAGPGGGAVGPQSRGVPSLEGGNPNVPEPQFRPSDALPPQVVSNPQNSGLLQYYDEAVTRGDMDLASILENILHTNALGTY